MTVEQRERRKLAKRIVKAVQPALEEALRNEGELSGRPFEKQIRELDMMLDNSILSRRESFAGSLNGEELEIRSMTKLPNGNHAAESQEVDMVDVPNEGVEEADGSIAQLNGELTADTRQIVAHTPPASTNGTKGDNGPESSHNPNVPIDPAAEPPTPPLSLGELQQPTLAAGGIPWYVEPFDPDGTTLHEERWTGPEVLREMSEELTDIDDEELNDLGGLDDDVIAQDTIAITTSNTPVARNRRIKKNGKPRRRWRGFK
jgi:NuA3 HAT complex component NTO1